MSIPASSPYVVVGAGIHGLSTAYHLAKELGRVAPASGADVVVLDKTHAGAGAAGSRAASSATTTSSRR